MIDSHCHLADAKFKKDLDGVLLRAEEHGVHICVTISDSLKEAEECFQLAEKYEQIYYTVGVHPHNAKDWKSDDAHRLKKLIGASSKAKAVGEIGLDYHYDNSPRDMQQEVFAIQLQLAKELELPAVIHNRESIADLKRIVWEIDPPAAVLHCCTEKWEDVADWVKRGYLLGFTGIATYPNAEDIREVITKCPVEQMMIETDAPYLAPVPHRGKRNEPAFVVEVAKLVAEIKGMSLDEIDRITTENTVRFYGL